MSNRQKILILFDGPHLAYSPTAIQLYDELSLNHDVTIIAQNPNNYDGNRVKERNTRYYPYYGVKLRHIYLVLFKILCLANGRARHFRNNKLDYRDYFFRFLFIKNQIRKEHFHRVICIDITNLFFCSEMKLKVDYLSLELCRNEQLLLSINKSIINCVIIQSKERFEYLFKNELIKTFIIHNAPIYSEIDIPENRNGLIYSGAANDMFCFYHCLDYLLKYPEEIMNLQGALLPADEKIVEAKYLELVKDGRLIIHKTYLESNVMATFLANFEIGFCFYNFDHPYIKANFFNYASAPSGKMFKYLASGVPVVCSNIPGFNFVREFRCGVLIDEPTEENIRRAILEIRSHYNDFVENAKSAAKHYSFDIGLTAYKNYIDGDLSENRINNV